MNKKIKIILFASFAIIFIVGATGLFLINMNKLKFWTSAVFAKNDPLNITYKINGQNYTLINGKAEKEIAPGSAQKDVISVFGEPVYGDLNSDGVKDAVMFLTENSGGSGTFFYVVEAINLGGRYKGTDAMFIGDRIAPQNINIQNGRAVVNYADRKPGESFAVPPSEGKSIHVNLDVKKMEIGELVQNFEGESR